MALICLAIWNNLKYYIKCVAMDNKFLSLYSYHSLYTKDLQHLLQHVSCKSRTLWVWHTELSYDRKNLRNMKESYLILKQTDSLPFCVWNVSQTYRNNLVFHGSGHKHWATQCSLLSYLVHSLEKTEALIVHRGK